MAEPIIWQGVGENPKGLTPFGWYDDEAEFQHDAPRVADWVARRLGYPTLAVEMVDAQIYACFEEAITEYSHQVNQFNIREYMFELKGKPGDQDLSGRNIAGNPLPFLTIISEDYGTEVGVGGTVDWKKGYIDTVDGQQIYDLQTLWADSEEDGNRLEIRRIFHNRTPAVNRSYWFGDFYGANSFLTSFGWGQGSGFGVSAYGGVAGGAGGYGIFGYPGYSYVLHPIFDTILRAQAVELGDMVFKSAYTFEVVNNKLRLFPCPSFEFRLWFEYTVREERQSLDRILSPEDVLTISDYANVPYNNIMYEKVNDVGRRWIMEYALACAKDVLGHIRGKFGTIPIPNAEVTLDGDALRSEAQEEKTRLLEQLRETLEATGREKQMEKQRLMAEATKEIFAKVPMFIYIG